MAISSIAAAAVFAFLWFPQNTGQNGSGGARNADALAVASADDVEILRILEVDVDRLVIGEPPLGRPIVLASVEDIDGLRIAKDTDGMMPKVSMVPAIGAPITSPIVATMSSGATGRSTTSDPVRSVAPMTCPPRMPAPAKRTVCAYGQWSRPA